MSSLSLSLFNQRARVRVSDAVHVPADIFRLQTITPGVRRKRWGYLAPRADDWIGLGRGKVVFPLLLVYSSLKVVVWGGWYYSIETYQINPPTFYQCAAFHIYCKSFATQFYD